MGILANTVSLCQFQIHGDSLPDDLYQWASTRLTEQAFRPITQGSEELSIGWVNLDNPETSDFITPRLFWRDYYLVFSMRRDQKRIPAALLKPYLEKAEAEFLAAHPGFHRVPRQKREELRDMVRSSLLAKILPIPGTFDVLWDTRSGRVGFAGLNSKAIEQFDDLFRQTFEGLRLVAVHPYARAEAVLDPDYQALLQQANQAGSDAVLDLIEGNRWLGQDFLLWLMYQTMETSSRYAVNQPGPAQTGEEFSAYLNDRLLLKGGGEGGMQKITVIGPQDAFSEVRTALQNGKQITEAILHMEKLEHQWKLTLKGENFHFASLKAPPVRIEKDDYNDEAAEKEAVFFERMYVLEEGLQLFDSLYQTFLRDRLGEGWQQTVKRIEKWLWE